MSERKIIGVARIYPDHITRQLEAAGAARDMAAINRLTEQLWTLGLVRAPSDMSMPWKVGRPVHAARWHA